MSLEHEAGYDPGTVYAYLVAHGTQRPDGRFLTFNGRLLDDTHRDTFERWFGEPWWPRVPLERFDEILLIYGVMLWEYEDWATAHLGGPGFISSVLP